MSKELSTLLNEIGIKAKSASAILNTATSDQKNKFFDFAVASIQENADVILAANKLDIKAAENNKKDVSTKDGVLNATKPSLPFKSSKDNLIIQPNYINY